MTSNFGLTAFQARRKALINLALKKDPLPIRQKPAVSFVEDSPVNELPTINTHINVISTPHVTVDELPPVSPYIIPTSARSISTLSPIL